VASTKKITSFTVTVANPSQPSSSSSLSLQSPVQAKKEACEVVDLLSSPVAKLNNNSSNDQVQYSVDFVISVYLMLLFIN
jgi:hypothetical protein